MSRLQADDADVYRGHRGHYFILFFFIFSLFFGIISYNKNKYFMIFYDILSFPIFGTLH